MTLAVAEEACEFEHRDLHWGNVLLNRGAPDAVAFRLNGVDVSVRTAGVATVLIDFSLSRLVGHGGAVAFCDLSTDPELFTGPKGNTQADTYRRMRKLTRGRWAGFHPGTNCLWMHYLADTLLSVKGIKLSPTDSHALKVRQCACRACAPAPRHPLPQHPKRCACGREMERAVGLPLTLSIWRVT